jgi:hypothetical protein
MGCKQAGVQKMISARAQSERTERTEVERAGRPPSGVFAIPLAVAAAYDIPIAHDEFTGLDRLDREELDEVDDEYDGEISEVRVIVPATLVRTA